MLSVHCYGQDDILEFPKFILEDRFKNSISFSSEIPIYNVFKMYVEPQFGGLFENSLKSVVGITNFHQFYNFYDVGFNIGLTQQLNKSLKLIGVCNLGVMRFRTFDVAKPESYLVKVSLSYAF
ncbi:hypothetical protein ICJ83_09950 [Aestuariibaculum sp. TT11]|uniref:Uncharacterized protein n=2 Tax=Aestuariibaculum sediminum TaxID=2770637 RepID=A0A8J6U7T0_9FLAO|nr:hypothetical protein [Aestuariibaculum sediminum]